MAFNFGSTTTPTFGTTTAAPSPFGATQATATPFGTAATQPQQSFFTSTPSTSQATNSLFGTTQPQTSFAGFGATPFGTSQAQTNTLFSKPAQATSFFNTGSSFTTPATQQQPSSLFGSLQKPGLFGTQPNFLAQQQQQVQMQQPVDTNLAFYQSIFQVNKFGDERDSVLANFNYLQACMGTGKGYYSQTLPPCTYSTANPFYRCKAVGYEFVYTNNNEDGLVSFEMKKSHEKIRAEETQFITSLQQMLGRQSIFFKISGIKATSEEQCLVNIFAEDQATLRRIPATDLASAFLQPSLKPHLDTWGVTNISAKVRPSPEQLKRYLDTPPEGIDPRVWQQAQTDNPDPANMIPAPIIGIDALKKRITVQQSESEHHVARMSLIDEECIQYQNRHATVAAEIQQMKRRQGQLAHRLLSVIVRQEVIRKAGTAVSVHEEEFEKRLEALDEAINSPTEFKGRLKELLSQIHLHQYTGPSLKYTIDEASLYQIKDVLEVQQEGLKHLVHTVKKDMETLQSISDNVIDTTLTIKSV